jgi:hypothetical protein
VPVVEARTVVPVEPGLAFAVSQTQPPVRLRWDPFVRSQRLLDATRPDKGVRTLTRHRLGLRMVSEYVSYAPPRNVGMKMITGPWFFARFGGGWQFKPGPETGTTEAVWRYNFSIRPRWLAPLADPIGRVVLGRDIRRRIAGFARGCADDVVLAAARADLAARD